MCVLAKAQRELLLPPMGPGGMGTHRAREREGLIVLVSQEATPFQPWAAESPWEGYI